MKLNWAPQDVEAETLAGYRHIPSFPFDQHRLNAWNRAVSLGGEHYEAWRKENIAPIRNSAYLERRHIWNKPHPQGWEDYITGLEQRLQALMRREWLERGGELPP